MTNDAYMEFVGTKNMPDMDTGHEVSESDINPMLFRFQIDITRWALRRGRAAIFADCGLGKTPMQLEWARHVVAATGKPVLILAPLAVSFQTKQEGVKFGVDVTLTRSQDDVVHGVNITNYEMLSHYDAAEFGGLVLDESSILKSYDGTTRKAITEFARVIPYRLACTATPAPNDITEIVNHAEYLDVMTGKEILANYFIQDGNTTHKWRLKGHAQNGFWQWMASWSVALRKPSDLGYPDDDFELPKLHVLQHEIPATETNIDTLFPMEAQTLQERRKARQLSINERVQRCADLVNENGTQWLVWCDLNRESELLKKAINGAVEVKGADSKEHKETSMLGFSTGDVRVLVTKPSIAGFGMNWQNCSHMAFVGLSDSYEKYYQAMRRCWRFGQENEVYCHIITAETEGAVVANVQRKERDVEHMMTNLVDNMNLAGQQETKRHIVEYAEDTATGPNWTLYQGDSVLTIDNIPDESIGLSVFSPPFPGMYVYTNSPHDMGNVSSIHEMIDQFRHLMTKDKMLRVMMPGRSCCIHLTQAVAFKGADGYIGIKDFRGKVIAMMEDEGWRYYGEVCIDKDPQVKAIRTKDQGLLFKTLAKDSSKLHMALADYLIQFRKPGDNTEPIRAGISDTYNNLDGWITPEEWIEWAAPVWYRQSPHMPGGIKETRVLNYREAREQDDEKHLCPLQLGVIERAVKLWSAPGDTVYSPFAGIGSEGYVALRLGRKFIGGELKRSYFDVATRNLQNAESQLELDLA